MDKQPFFKIVFFSGGIMDIRIEKTRAAIKEAFLALRSEKPLEKITIKELCRLAQINKSTFYSHYDDIFDLENTIEVETIQVILRDIAQGQEYSTDNPEVFAREIFHACLSHSSLTNLIFVDNDGSRLLSHLETGIKELIYQKYPHYQDDPKMHVLLTFCIHGAHHAYHNNKDVSSDILFACIEDIFKCLRPLYK